jgi:hypothetical protein
MNNRFRFDDISQPKNALTPGARMPALNWAFSNDLCPIINGNSIPDG